MREPPLEPAERIFRTLLARHPERPIATRVAGVGLSVRAISSREEWEALDASQREEAEELRDSVLQREILFRVLRVGAGPAFSSIDEVGLLSDGVCEQLLRDVSAVLAIIGPTYARSDVDAWMRVLERGAEANAYEAIALASCVDVTMGYGVRSVTPRPDRYWGCAVGELLDGHWMAYRAARTVMERCT